MSAKAEKVLEVLEPVVEEAVEVVETVERIPRLRLNGTTRKQQMIILGFTALAAGTVAAVAAYKVAQKRVEARYEEIVEREVAETRAFYQQLQKPSIEQVAQDAGVVLAPDATAQVAEAVEAIERYQGKVPYDKPEVSRVIAGEPEVQTSNVFVDGEPMTADFDYDSEIPQRSEDAPYIITYEEFNQGEKNYIQNSLTWYEGDDTLTDDKDQPIPDVDNVVGEHNMHRFGHGSRDPRIVYVRNDAMEVDFEVAQNKTGYASAVLGLRHSMDRPGSRKTPRFRGEDG